MQARGLRSFDSQICRPAPARSAGLGRSLRNSPPDCLATFAPVQVLVLLPLKAIKNERLEKRRGLIGKLVEPYPRPIRKRVREALSQKRISPLFVRCANIINIS